MKVRVLIAFVLILGLAFVMLITVNQETKAEDVGQLIPALVASRHTARLPGDFQDTAVLDHTPEITFTSAFTVYLPMVASKTSPFSVQVVGYEEHGAMIELFYDGEWSGLNGAVINISTSQNGNEKETQSIGVYDGRYLAEMTDAMYDLGRIDVVLSGNEGHSAVGSTTVELSTQYGKAIPWMRWLYGSSGVNDPGLPRPEHPEAYDLQPVSEQYPDGDGHPVVSPCDGIVYRSEVIPGTVDTHNFQLYCTVTGYLVQLGHMDNQKSVGDNVVVGDLVGYLHWEQVVSRPHNHTTVRRPNSFPPDIHESITRNSTWVDMLNPHVQLGGTPLEFGFWLGEPLPQSVKDMIAQGIFLPIY